MIEIARLDHVSFAVQDVDASRRFFGGVLGLPEIDRPAFDFRGAWFGIGDRSLHLIEQEVASRTAAAKLTRADHMALEVKDMDAVKQALDSAEIPYQLGTNDSRGFRQVFCADPDGHTIEFISRG
ncbi:MAG: VOC family protein [Acidobacteria bacterium]|nr:VOC family protein [Acidobacteriota bacterium]MDA1236694.1 VOC family protein [Acidobacteriota bacterium]